MSTIRPSRLVLPALLFLAAGCGGSDAPPAASSGTSDAAAATAAQAVSPEALDQARSLFATRCAPCHGKSGRGDGPAAAGLNPKPRNYTDSAWQATIADEMIEKAIVEGGPAVGKSTLMPPNPDLKDKPEVVAGLRALVRSFAKN